MRVGRENAGDCVQPHCLVKPNGGSTRRHDAKRGFECNRLWVLKNSIFPKTAKIPGVQNV